MSTIRWVHLSDIHYSYSNYSTKRLRKSLLKYINHKIKNKINFVFLTGDITYKGESYNEDIFEFLEGIKNTLEIDYSNLLMVPGNHDLHRSDFRENLINGILNNENPFNKIDKLDNKSYNAILEAQNPYYDFYKKIKKCDRPKETLHFIEEFEDCNIIHINTSWMCGFKGEEENLFISIQKLLDTLENLKEKECKVNIALGHHDAICFNPEIQSRFKNLLAEYNIDIYLNGHSHKPRFNIDVNNINPIHTFTCGAFVEDDYSIPSMLIGEVDTDNGRSKVEFFRWYDENEIWAENMISRKGESFVSFNINRLISQTQSDNLIYDEENEVDEIEFKQFILSFHEQINDYDNEDSEVNWDEEDIRRKFKNMVCSNTFRHQFDKYSVYFPLVDDILENPNFIGFDREVIPDIIITTYSKIFRNYTNGDDILLALIEELYETYVFNGLKNIKISKSKINLYLKIMVLWSINECDIFNEILSREVS